jgi:DNA-binding IscR family transcriptional regulator
VVTLLEGDLKLSSCVHNGRECDRWECCVTRIIWAEATRAFLEKLQATTVQDLMDRVACLTVPEECDADLDKLPVSPENGADRSREGRLE